MKTLFPNFAKLLQPLVNFFHFINFKFVINLPSLVLLAQYFAFGPFASVWEIACLLESKWAAKALSGVIA